MIGHRVCKLSKGRSGWRVSRRRKHGCISIRRSRLARSARSVCAKSKLPRLGVVALVCRHWRACALRSVTQVGDGAPAYLAALPSLTMLHASSETLRCDPSPSLRILSYNSRGAALGGCSCHHLRGLSRLTRLTLDTDLGAGCCTEAHALIARNADTLEKLALAMGPQTPSAASSALLSSPRLPRLCALQMTLVPDAVSLVQTHASQLTRLTVEFSSADHSTALTLPMCRSLKIVGAIAPAALNWALPALTSIKCNLFTGPPGDLPLEALRTLLMHQFTANRAVGQLSRCTGLRDLTFWGTPSGLPLNDLPPLPAPPCTTAVATRSNTANSSPTCSALR